MNKIKMFAELHSQANRKTQNILKTFAELHSQTNTKNLIILVLTSNHFEYDL